MKINLTDDELVTLHSLIYNVGKKFKTLEDRKAMAELGRKFEGPRVYSDISRTEAIFLLNLVDKGLELGKDVARASILHNLLGIRTKLNEKLNEVVHEVSGDHTRESEKAGSDQPADPVCDVQGS